MVTNIHHPLAQPTSAAFSPDTARESYEQFEKAFRYAAIGMALVRPDGHWLRVNNALCNILGYTEQELLKTNFQALTYPEDLAEDESLVQRMLQGKIHSYQLEKRYIHKDKHIVSALLSVSLIYDHDYKPKHFIAQIHDISQQKAAEKALKDALETLLASNMELERFAYACSHDLQEPLRNMDGYAAFLETLTSSAGDPRVKACTGALRQNLQRMMQMIDGMLEYAKFDGVREKHQNVVLDEVMREVLALQEQAIRKKEAQITIQPLPSIRGNHIQIVRLFQNLVANALKFNQSAVPQVEISSTACVQDPRMVQLNVRDNGIGMPEDFLAKAFEPFSRLHRTQEYSGSGIGLASCRRIVEAHGGKIWMESEVGKGTEFHLTLPLLTASDQPGDA